MCDFGIDERTIGFSITGNEKGLGSNAKHTSNRWGCEFRYVDGKIVRVYNFGQAKGIETERLDQTEPNRGRSLAGRPSLAPWKRSKPQIA